VAYLALFAWSFLAATLIPLGSEPMVLTMAYQDYHTPSVLAVATIGNTLGAVTTYLLARYAATRVEPKGVARRALAIVARYGYPALLFSWAPIIGDAIVAAAGAASMRFAPFLVLTAAGKLCRYWLLVAIIDAPSTASMIATMR
jgi:membrane protein YqaA with SNARE-associated domain